MKRIVIKCKDDLHINVEGDFFRLDDDFLLAWNGDALVAIVKTELVQMAYIADK